MVWQRGVRMALDVGDVRIGVARCGADGLMAVPVETIQRQRSPEQGLVRIAELTEEYNVSFMYVGLPISLRGAQGPAAQRIRSYASRVAHQIAPTEVRLIDERLSTVSAHRVLREAGVAGKKHRTMVDQVAAVTLLEQVLAVEKPGGDRLGKVIAAPHSQDADRHNGRDA